MSEALYLDTSALVKLYVTDDKRQLALCRAIGLQAQRIPGSGR